MIVFAKSFSPKFFLLVYINYFTEWLISRRIPRPNFFSSIYVLFLYTMFLLSKVNIVRTKLFIQYRLTFSQNIPLRYIWSFRSSNRQSQNDVVNRQCPIAKYFQPAQKLTENGFVSSEEPPVLPFAIFTHEKKLVSFLIEIILKQNKYRGFLPICVKACMPCENGYRLK